jgi:2-desacetyl-2-hydroxyethyl bacteriochlorophyllide A dehydrogenase
MRIAILRGPHDFEIADEPTPDVEPDDVLVRTSACGVCASELDMWRGESDVEFPHFPGHEVSGVVEKVGRDVSEFAPGDAVAVWVKGRGFAEYVAVKAEHCLPAAGLPIDLALAEPVACAVNAVELARVSLADDVVIIGAGFMGNLTQKLVTLRGPRHVIVADTRPDALERARELGATHVVHAGRESLADVVAEATGGVGADISFEVTGVQAGLDPLHEITRQSGKVVIVGYHQGGTRELPLADWNWNAYEIINAHFREVSTIMRGMRVGMRLLTSGRLRIDDLVTHRFALDEIGAAFQQAHDKPAGFVKSTVTIAA